MPEPQPEIIVAALKTRLEGIVGDAGVTYWYTPHRVLRFAAWCNACLSASLGSYPSDPATIYTLSPDDEDSEENTYTGTQSVMRIDLSLAQRFEPAGDLDPFNQPDPDRWKVQQRLRNDARKRLRGDLKVGNTAMLVRIPLVDMSAEETFVKGWAVVFMRLEVLYAYEDAA